MLVREKLNIVGETHTESNARRDAERQFCLAKTGSANYWTEADFPDLGQGGQQVTQFDPAADLMEFRATHGAAMLIDKFDKLGDEGVTVSATPVRSAAPAISTFDGKVRDLMLVRERIDRSWRPSSQEVDKAVRDVHDAVERAYQKYDAAFRNASTEQRLKAVRDFTNSRVDLRDLVPALAAAVGVSLSDGRDAAELAKYMRKQRSTFMGLGAVFSQRAKRVGVWKVGDLHIADLLNGTSNVRANEINIVTKADFNQEFAAWQSNPTT